MGWLEFHCRHRYASGFELDVSFNLGEGASALVGPSGSGKSTILACIAGVLRPDVGHVQLAGDVLLDTAKKRFVPPERRGIGVVFQDRLLFPHLSVRGNLQFGLRRQRNRFIDFNRLVDVLELGGLLDRYPHTLSGGERQRIAIGRAILRGPRLLLLDEPLTALDDELKGRVLGYIRRAIAEYQLPTLLVSHDMNDVSYLTNETIRIRRGRLASGQKGQLKKFDEQNSG
jgi:molybdate transport system ATP-binding protein